MQTQPCYWLNHSYQPVEAYNYTIRLSDIPFTVDDLFHEMGYRSFVPDEQIIALASSQLEMLRDTVTPSCSFKLFNGQIRENELLLDGSTLLHIGPTISTLLEGSESFALFVATAGAAFHKYQEALKAEDDVLKSFIADMIGTCIVEKTGDYLERLLESKIGSLRHTNRFSPGYCGWHLSGQQELFGLMGESTCGVRLSDVFLMTPIKSISGVIGIGESVNEKRYGCQYCELETCYKKKRYEKNG